jgi:hypothetical protein
MPHADYSFHSKPQTLNDEERRIWILNDEGLYNWQRSSKLGMRQFIRQNRAESDQYILPVLNGHKPAHHGAYGH